MTNLIFRDPDVIFVHLPKTGGTSVRDALGGKIVQRFFGHIPQEFSNLLCISIIRDPRSRFLSAFRMFKYGSLLKGDYYEQPRWPDLTISETLDILEDPWIGYDRSRRNLSWNLKHHIIPQTHPFNCLKYANRILRFENLTEDFSNLCGELNISVELPTLRVSKNKTENDEEWSGTDHQRFREIFASDYDALGYLSGKTYPTNVKTSIKAIQSEMASPTVFELWPSYFSDRTILMESAEEALPLPNVKLEAFLDDIILGQSKASWAGRSVNLIEHFQKLQPEFSGASRLSHLLACTIVVLRRNPECSNARILFWRILDGYTDAILSEISLRWRVAITDTIADLGRSTGERAVAFSASVFANSTKLYESELSIFYPQRPWPPKKRLSAGGELFDGMRTYWTKKGDLISNMFERSSRIADLEPIAGKFLQEIIARLSYNETVYKRLALIAGKPDVPMVEDEVKQRLHRIAKRRL